MENSWHKIKERFYGSPNSIEILDKAILSNGNTLLDTVVNNASIIIVNKYLRILCSGNSYFENILKFNNKYKYIIGENKYVLAHDAFGGIFVLTSFGIQYFSPDTLHWESLEINYEGFLEWISTSDIDEFYSCFLWDGYNNFMQNLSSNSGILMYPFLWAKECDVNTSSKKIIPFGELLEINFEFAKEFEGASLEGDV